MNLLAFFLVFSAAFCHATWNFYVKKLNAGPELIWLFSACSTVIYAPFAIYAIARHGAFSWLEWLFIAGTVVLHLGYFLLLQLGYRKGDLSLVYPTARATGPLISSGLAVALLGEQMSAQMALGAALIIFGVFMLTGGIRKSARHAVLSVGFGLLVGFIIGLYTIWDAYAVSTLMIAPIIMDYASGLGRATLLAPVAYRRQAETRALWRDHWREVLLIAVLNALAYILVLTALTFTPVTYVAPLREVSVLLSVLAGSVLLGEGHLRTRLGWSVVILLGMSILITA